MNLIPKTSRLKVRSHDKAASLGELRKADHVFLLEPKLSRHRLTASLPFKNNIDQLGKRSVKSDFLTHSGDAKTPSFTYAEYAAEQTAHERLTLARQLFASLKNLKPSKVAVVCNDKDANIRCLMAEAVAAAGHAYLCPLTQFKKSNPAAPKISTLDVYRCEGLDIKRLSSEANGNNIARVLAGLPPNLLDAKNYIKECQQLAKSKDWKCEVFNEAKLKKLGAGAFLAVAQGNDHGNAGIVRLRRNGKQKTPWLSLVGKGVCFDTGGVNNKPAAGMQEMHEDMQGSSVALGSFAALCDLRPNDTIECWLAITENRINGSAYTPTEIITAMNGTTIEIVHTDAEGRMALADTLDLASKSKPSMIIDYATLTGACVYALTERYSGAFSNREAFNIPIQKAGSSSGERVWPFPVDKDFDTGLESVYADIKQCSLDGKGDHIMATRFLSRFVDKKIPWIHIDLSAGHSKSGLGHIASGVTGFGVRFTCNLILDQKLHKHL